MCGTFAAIGRWRAAWRELREYVDVVPAEEDAAAMP
jgi:hypothetical protein